MGYLWRARLSFPVTTNSLPWVLTSPSADRAALLLHAAELVFDTQTCHDGRQINTCTLKPIWERGLCGWQSAGDGSDGGKYEVCVLTGEEMTKAKMMSGCYYCWHSTKLFPPSGHFTALSCSSSSSRHAQRHEVHLSRPCLIQPGTALANTLRLLTVSNKLAFSKHGNQYCSDCTGLISLHHLSHD